LLAPPRQFLDARNAQRIENGGNGAGGRAFGAERIVGNDLLALARASPCTAAATLSKRYGQERERDDEREARAEPLVCDRKGDRDAECQQPDCKDNAKKTFSARSIAPRARRLARGR